MRFICDVCPTTAADGQVVIIGQYEKWIRHLLSPQHQTEQFLVMSRTSYWPAANWIALVKNVPVHEEATAELFVDIVMTLSEYGFIEAVYSGDKNESLCVALQWYETRTVPQFIIGPDFMKYEVKLIPTLKVNFANGVQYDLTSGGRRFRYNCAPVPKSESSILKTSDVALSPISHPLKETIRQDDKGEETIRIKYDRATLLNLCQQVALPPRFVEISEFPRHIVEEEAKFVDLMKMHQQLNNRFNGYRNKAGRDMGQQHVQGNITNSSATSRWPRELKPVLKKEEDW